MQSSSAARLLSVLLAFGTVAPAAFAADTSFVPVTDAMLQHPAPGDWLMWRRTLDSWGYSPLEQITKDNVGKLEQMWVAATGTGGQESTSGYPIVFGVAGKEYVAVTTGTSLVAAASRRVTPELPPDTGTSQLFVFALP